MSAKNWPKLSETLPFPAGDLHNCQNCNCFGVMNGGLERWQESNNLDEKTGVAVILCKPCADRIIEPHPRLYRRLTENEPLPGSMLICLDCVNRNGAVCTDLKSGWNGGPGLNITIATPASAMIDGPKYRGRINFFLSPATACDCQKTKN